MWKKYIICDNHADKAIGKAIIKKIKDFCEKNPDLTVLLEGVPSGITSENFGEHDKSFLSQLKTNQEIDPRVLFMTEVINSNFKWIGVDDETDSEEEPITSIKGSIMQHYDTKEFKEEFSLKEQKNNPEKFLEYQKRDTLLFEQFKNFEGDAVLVIGIAHVFDWIEKALVTEDLINKENIIYFTSTGEDLLNRVRDFTLALKLNLSEEEVNELANFVLQIECAKLTELGLKAAMIKSDGTILDCNIEAPNNKSPQENLGAAEEVEVNKDASILGKLRIDDNDFDQTDIS